MHNQRCLSSFLCDRAIWIAALIFVPLGARAQTTDLAFLTIYRASSTLRGNTIFSCNHNRYKIVVYRGNQKLLRIQKGRFATVDLSPGHYTFKTSRSHPLEIDLVAGGQYFIRPRQTCGGVLRAVEAIDLVPCTEATAEAQPVNPLDAKDIYIEKSAVQNLRYFSGSCAVKPGP